MSRSMRVRALLTALGVLTTVGLTSCGGDDDSSGNASPDAKSSSASSGGAAQVAVTLASGGSGDTCTLDTDSVEAGPVTFTVTNESATGITEVELLSGLKILGEKENLAPGLGPVNFTLTLGGGDYEIYCPGATEESLPFTVTGEASQSTGGSTQQALQEGATEYGTYVDTQVSAMLDGVKKLQDAIDSGDLAAAQEAYAQSRVYYERIESDVEGFVLPGFKPTDNNGNLDYLIDMRASNIDPAVGWHGFHAIERDLFGREKITAGTKKYAAELTKNVTKLVDVAKTLTYAPEDLANGAAGLLEEVQANKISGEEEAFSHIDLLDFAGNVEGAKEAFAYLQPGLEQIDPELTATITDRFDAVDDMLDDYRDPNALGGYVLYTPALRKTDANKLSQSVQALQDSLSRLAEKVATA
ncbi:MAG: EfeM/EfeO family lipoprotein [Nocardioides sp.]|uniref:iron uptake system protein EfeO n=1 Tax=Nocardioides sp. TaxID=35761 RepID=UPI0039E7238D